MLRAYLLVMEFVKKFLIRVFCSGESGVVQVQMAVARIRRNVKGAKTHLKVEYASNKHVREDPETFGNPSGLFSWLTKADVYLIPSQGIWMGLIHSDGAYDSGWHVAGIADMLQNLASSSNIGFPLGKQLSDPVWNGNKAVYVFLLGVLAIPTLRIDLNQISDQQQFEAVGLEVYL